MKDDIKGIEKIEHAMGGWCPRDLVMIECMELMNSFVYNGMSLKMEALFQRRAAIWPNFDKEMFRVTITFDDVRSLNLKGFGGGAVQITGFDIHFIGDRGWEKKVNFEVEDYEDNRIQFKCGAISIESCEANAPT